jgi:hypothetical protein
VSFFFFFFVQNFKRTRFQCCSDHYSPASNADPYLVTGKIIETIMADFDAPEIAPKDREVAHVQPENMDIAELEVHEVVEAVDETPTESVPEEAPKPIEQPRAPEKPRPAPSNDPYSSEPVEFACCRG